VLLLFAGVVTYFSVTGTTNRITRHVGGCVSHGQFVPCSRPHDSVVLKVLEHGGTCPSTTNGYVIQGSRVYCLGRA